MKKLCALIFLSSTLSACVTQEGYYMNEGQYDRPPVVIVDNNVRMGPTPVRGRYYHRGQRYIANTPAPAVVVVPPSNMQGPSLVPAGPSRPVVRPGPTPGVVVVPSSNAPGPRPEMPRSMVRGHEGPRANSPRIVVSSP